MAMNLQSLFDKIMDDPDVIPENGVDKKDLALDMIQQKAKQSNNNNKALNMIKASSAITSLAEFLQKSERGEQFIREYFDRKTPTRRPEKDPETNKLVAPPTAPRWRFWDSKWGSIKTSTDKAKAIKALADHLEEGVDLPAETTDPTSLQILEGIRFSMTDATSEAPFTLRTKQQTREDKIGLRYQESGEEGSMSLGEPRLHHREKVVEKDRLKAGTLLTDQTGEKMWYVKGVPTGSTMNIVEVREKGLGGKKKLQVQNSLGKWVDYTDTVKPKVKPVELNPANDKFDKTTEYHFHTGQNSSTSVDSLQRAVTEYGRHVRETTGVTAGLEAQRITDPEIERRRKRREASEDFDEEDEVEEEEEDSEDEPIDIFGTDKDGYVIGVRPQSGRDKGKEVTKYKTLKQSPKNEDKADELRVQYNATVREKQEAEDRDPVTSSFSKEERKKLREKYNEDIRGTWENADGNTLHMNPERARSRYLTMIRDIGSADLQEFLPTGQYKVSVDTFKGIKGTPTESVEEEKKKIPSNYADARALSPEALLHHLVEQEILQPITRGERNKQEIEDKTTQLADTKSKIRRAATIRKAAFKQRGLTPKLDTDSGLPQFDGDVFRTKLNDKVSERQQRRADIITAQERLLDADKWRDSVSNLAKYRGEANQAALQTEYERRGQFATDVGQYREYNRLIEEAEKAFTDATSNRAKGVATRRLNDYKKAQQDVATALQQSEDVKDLALDYNSIVRQRLKASKDLSSSGMTDWIVQQWESIETEHTRTVEGWNQQVNSLPQELESLKANPNGVVGYSEPALHGNGTENTNKEHASGHLDVTDSMKRSEIHSLLGTTSARRNHLLRLLTQKMETVAGTSEEDSDMPNATTPVSTYTKEEQTHNLHRFLQDDSLLYSSALNPTSPNAYENVLKLDDTQLIAHLRSAAPTIDVTEHVRQFMVEDGHGVKVLVPSARAKLRQELAHSLGIKKVQGKNKTLPTLADMDGYVTSGLFSGFSGNIPENAERERVRTASGKSGQQISAEDLKMMSDQSKGDIYYVSDSDDSHELIGQLMRAFSFDDITLDDINSPGLPAKIGDQIKEHAVSTNDDGEEYVWLNADQAQEIWKVLRTKLNNIQDGARDAEEAEEWNEGTSTDTMLGHNAPMERADEDNPNTNNNQGGRVVEEDDANDADLQATEDSDKVGREEQARYKAKFTPAEIKAQAESNFQDVKEKFADIMGNTPQGFIDMLDPDQVDKLIHGDAYIRPDGEGNPSTSIWHSTYWSGRTTGTMSADNSHRRAYLQDLNRKMIAHNEGNHEECRHGEDMDKTRIDTVEEQLASFFTDPEALNAVGVGGKNRKMVSTTYSGKTLDVPTFNPSQVVATINANSDINTAFSAPQDSEFLKGTWEGSDNYWARDYGARLGIGSTLAHYNERGIQTGALGSLRQLLSSLNPHGENTIEHHAVGYRGGTEDKDVRIGVFAAWLDYMDANHAELWPNGDAWEDEGGALVRMDVRMTDGSIQQRDVWRDAIDVDSYDETERMNRLEAFHEEFPKVLAEFVKRQARKAAPWTISWIDEETEERYTESSDHGFESVNMDGWSKAKIAALEEQDALFDDYLTAMLSSDESALASRATTEGGGLLYQKWLPMKDGEAQLFFKDNWKIDGASGVPDKVMNFDVTVPFEKAKTQNYADAQRSEDIAAVPVDDTKPLEVSRNAARANTPRGRTSRKLPSTLPDDLKEEIIELAGREPDATKRDEGIMEILKPYIKRMAHSDHEDPDPNQMVTGVNSLNAERTRDEMDEFVRVLRRQGREIADNTKPHTGKYTTKIGEDPVSIILDEIFEDTLPSSEEHTAHEDDTHLETAAKMLVNEGIFSDKTNAGLEAARDFLRGDENASPPRSAMTYDQIKDYHASRLQDTPLTSRNLNQAGLHAFNATQKAAQAEQDAKDARLAAEQSVTEGHLAAEQSDEIKQMLTDAELDPADHPHILTQEQVTSAIADKKAQGLTAEAEHLENVAEHEGDGIKTDGTFDAEDNHPVPRRALSPQALSFIHERYPSDEEGGWKDRLDKGEFHENGKPIGVKELKENHPVGDAGKPPDEADLTALGGEEEEDAPITWDQNTTKYNHELKNNQIIRDSNDNLYVVDRLSGYNIELLGINEDGSWRKDGDRTINTSTASPEFDKDTSYFPHTIGEGETAIDNHRDLVAAKSGTQQRMDMTDDQAAGKEDVTFTSPKVFGTDEPLYEFEGTKQAMDAFIEHYGSEEAFKEALKNTDELKLPEGKKRWGVTDARDHVKTLITSVPKDPAAEAEPTVPEGTEYDSQLGFSGMPAAEIDIKELKAQQTEARGNRRKLVNQQASTTDTVEELTDDVNEAEQNQQVNNEALDTANARIKKLEANAKNAVTAYNAAATVATDLADQIVELQEKLEEEQANGGRQEIITDLNKQLKERKKTQKEANTALKDATSERDAVQDNLEKQQADNQTLQEKVAKQTDEVKQLKTNLKNSKNKAKEITQQLNVTTQELNSLNGSEVDYHKYIVGLGDYLKSEAVSGKGIHNYSDDEIALMVLNEPSKIKSLYHDAKKIVQREPTADDVGKKDKLIQQLGKFVHGKEGWENMDEQERKEWSEAKDAGFSIDQLQTEVNKHHNQADQRVIQARSTTEATQESTKKQDTEKHEVYQANEISSLVGDIPDDMDNVAATHMAREIMTHALRHGPKMDKDNQKKLLDQVGKLKEKGADIPQVNKEIRQHVEDLREAVTTDGEGHAHAGETRDAEGTPHGYMESDQHKVAVADHSRELERQTDYDELLTGDGGLQERIKSFNDMDFGSLVRTDKEGRVTETELSHHGFEHNKKLKGKHMVVDEKKADEKRLKEIQDISKQRANLMAKAHDQYKKGNRDAAEKIYDQLDSLQERSDKLVTARQGGGRGQGSAAHHDEDHHIGGGSTETADGGKGWHDDVHSGSPETHENNKQELQEYAKLNQQAHALEANAGGQKFLSGEDEEKHADLKKEMNAMVKANPKLLEMAEASGMIMSEWAKEQRRLQLKLPPPGGPPPSKSPLTWWAEGGRWVKYETLREKQAGLPDGQYAYMTPEDFDKEHGAADDGEGGTGELHPHDGHKGGVLMSNKGAISIGDMPKDEEGNAVRGPMKAGTGDLGRRAIRAALDKHGISDTSTVVGAGTDKEDIFKGTGLHESDIEKFVPESLTESGTPLGDQIQALADQGVDVSTPLKRFDARRDNPPPTAKQEGLLKPKKGIFERLKGKIKDPRPVRTPAQEQTVKRGTQGIKDTAMSLLDNTPFKSEKGKRARAIREQARENISDHQKQRKLGPEVARALTAGGGFSEQDFEDMGLGNK